MKLRYLLAASALSLTAGVVLPAPVMAQETTASVRGSVESEGAPVAGAEVVVTHVPSGTQLRTTTDANGGFSANGLRIGGPTTVEVSAAGFESAQVTDLYLEAGQALRLPVDIQRQQEIVVTASSLSGTLETSTGPTTALNREDIEGVATINRDIRDLARRDPFVTLDPTNSRTIEIAGNNGRLNRFSVDGATFGDDFGLNNGGLPTNRGPVPIDAIEQFTVKVAPYDISEGDFQGGAINVVLRSGGNRFRGSGFFSYTDDSLTGEETRNVTTNLDFDSKQYGGVLSGPIIPDTLFFMVAYERTEESDPFDNGIGAGFANQIPNLTQAQVDQVTQIASSVYGIDTLGISASSQEQDEKIVGKLDWNVNDNQRVALTFIRNEGTNVFQQNTSISTTSPTLGFNSNAYQLSEESNSGTLEVNSQWSDRFSTQLRASYRDYNRGQDALGGNDNAQFAVCLDPTSTGSGTSCSTGVPRLFFGPDIFRQANVLNTENLAIDFTARLDAGDHQFKLNLGYTNVHTFNLFQRRATGDLYFDSLADFQARRASQLQLRGSVPSLDPIDAAADFSSQQITVGLQDDWQITDTLLLNIGARYDLFASPTDVALSTAFLARNGYPNNYTFDGLGAFQPRFGFSWEPTDRLVVKGGAGIFAGGTPDVFLSNSYANTGFLDNEISITRANCAASGTCSALDNVTGVPPYPTVLTNFLIASIADAPVNAIDPDLELAKQFRTTLSVNYDADLGPLGDGWLFGVDGFYGETINGYTWFDARSVPIGTLPDGRTRYGPRDGVRTVNQDLIMTNDSRGRSIIGVARINKSWDWGLDIGGSYTRQDIKDVNALTSAQAGSLYSNNALIDGNFAAYGTSIYQIKDQWKFNIDFNRAFFGENNTRISIFGEYRSGRPYSLTMFSRNDANGRVAVNGTVGTGARTLLYIPTANDPLVAFDSAASKTAFDNLVAELGLEKYRGSVVPKNTQQSPDVFKIDLHLSQEIPLPSVLGADPKFELFADIENVLNMIDKDWGSVRQVGFPYTSTLVEAACVANGTNPCATYRYSAVQAPNEGLQTRQSLYGIRVGAKVKF